MGKGRERRRYAGRAQRTHGVRLPGVLQRRQPVSVRTIRRVHHVNETDVPLPERDETIETIEYSDGFGRLLQTRTQAEDVVFGDASFGDAGLPSDLSAPWETPSDDARHGDPRDVVVSGWQIYDNKGRVVEKYEPFFSAGWDYAARRRPSSARRRQCLRSARPGHPHGQSGRLGAAGGLRRPG